MKTSVLLSAAFLGAVSYPTQTVQSAIEHGFGATIHEFLETARLPTHIHDSKDVTCRLDKKDGQIHVTNLTTGEQKHIPAELSYSHHYRGFLTKGVAHLDQNYSVHVIEDGHPFADARCFAQLDVPYIPLAMQLRFQPEG